MPDPPRQRHAGGSDLLCRRVADGVSGNAAVPNRRDGGMLPIGRVEYCSSRPGQSAVSVLATRNVEQEALGYMPICARQRSDQRMLLGGVRQVGERWVSGSPDWENCR